MLRVDRLGMLRAVFSPPRDVPMDQAAAAALAALHGGPCGVASVELAGRQSRAPARLKPWSKAADLRARPLRPRAAGYKRRSAIGTTLYLTPLPAAPTDDRRGADSTLAFRLRRRPAAGVNCAAQARFRQDSRHLVECCARPGQALCIAETNSTRPRDGSLGKGVTDVTVDAPRTMSRAESRHHDGYVAASGMIHKRSLMSQRRKGCAHRQVIARAAQGPRLGRLRRANFHLTRRRGDAPRTAWARYFGRRHSAVNFRLRGRC